MKRLFFSIFDISKAIEQKNPGCGTFFRFKQAFACVFGPNGIESWRFAPLNAELSDGLNDERSLWDRVFAPLISELEQETQESSFPDEFTPLDAILTQVPWAKGLKYNKRSILVIPAQSRFQGDKQVLELEEKWCENLLKQWSFENPLFSEFLVSLNTSSLKNGLKKSRNIPFFINAHNSEIVSWISEREKKPKLLLHVCCGPDAAGVIELLKRHYDLHCFWYDPNIQPKAEYDKRLSAFEKVAEIEKVPYTVGEYDVDNFENRISGLEYSQETGAKCTKCYDMRLERSAIEAKKNGFDFYTTTLAISPHKVQEKLKNFGKLFESKYGIPYLARNFVKQDGFKNSVEYTKQHQIFRQDYCGCFYSLWEGGPEAQKKAAEWGYLPPKQV